MRTPRNVKPPRGGSGMSPAPDPGLAMLQTITNAANMKMLYDLYERAKKQVETLKQENAELRAALAQSDTRLRDYELGRAHL